MSIWRMQVDPSRYRLRSECHEESKTKRKPEESKTKSKPEESKTKRKQEGN